MGTAFPDRFLQLGGFFSRPIGDSPPASRRSWLLYEVRSKLVPAPARAGVTCAGKVRGHVGIELRDCTLLTSTFATQAGNIKRRVCWGRLFCPGPDDEQGPTPVLTPVPTPVQHRSGEAASGPSRGTTAPGPLRPDPMNNARQPFGGPTRRFAPGEVGHWPG